jgi:CheY-like chemotaxis protein
MKCETKRERTGLRTGLKRMAARFVRNQQANHGGLMNSNPNATGAGKAARWMVVDDNRDILELLRAMLEQFHGGTVECFHSPQAALAAFAAAPDAYEVVITDFEMPGMDGLELCRRMRALAARLKIFLATGSGFFTEAAARHAGFCGLLNKPFPFGALQTALANAGVETKINSAA